MENNNLIIARPKNMEFKEYRSLQSIQNKAIKKYLKEGSPKLIEINGKLVPIIVSPKQRKSKDRFINNKKSYHLTVDKTIRYKRLLQIVVDKKTFETKKIYHYLEQ